MNIQPTALPEVLIITPRVFQDPRGFFFESYNQETWRAAGIDTVFVQDNHSKSARGTLRGLHFQNPHAQGKLVYVLQGEVFDVAVDVRADSPTFGQWYGATLSAENHHQLFVPEGFAHGFCVTSDTALFAYKCTDFYRPDLEFSLLWNDPEIGIDWPVSDPELSDKDRQGQPLAEFARDSLAVW